MNPCKTSGVQCKEGGVLPLLIVWPLLCGITQCLKELDTFGNCQRQTSILTWCIPTYALKKKKLWKCWLNWSSNLWENNGRKNTLGTLFCIVCFQLHNKRLLLKSFIIWVRLPLSQKLLQRELFLTTFYTINSSPLLITKWVFMLSIIVSNYQ